MANILITGGTGLIGKLLTTKLINLNHSVRILTRRPIAKNDFYWNIVTKEIDKNAFLDLDYIIHLAGTGIADKRWTNSRKKKIIESRTISTQLLFTTIQELKINLKGFIAASAIGYYGAITSDKIFSETDKAANDFLGIVCNKWENSTLKFKNENIPTTILRIGIVLAKTGGAFSKMNTPFAISPIASGKQYMPWIHIEDLTNLFIKAIEDCSFTGIYNAVTPETQTSFSFAKLTAIKTKKIFIPFGVPKFILQLLFGEMAILLTTGSRVSSKKIEKTNFVFSFKNLSNALDDIIQKA